MGKKAFTLIELLAVIVVLGIILAIAIPSVALIIERSKEKSWENQQKLILQAAEKYIAMNPDKSPREGETIKITLENLIDVNLIEENIRNPKTNEIINPATEIVQVTNEGNGKFSYIFIEIDENLPKAKVYGVRFNLETGEVERLYDAVGMSYEKHIDDGTITSDFDTAEIYGEFEEVTDSYGNKFVKIPKFFIKKIKEGKTWTYLVSK